MAKGGSFEREVSKSLSLWWTKGESDAVFWRTSNSGGRATVRSYKGLKTMGQNGDITATNPIGQPLIDLVSIELKRGYNKATPMNCMETKNKNDTFFDFIKQSKRDAIKGEVPYWWLIHKRDRKGIMIYMPLEFKTMARITKPYCVFRTKEVDFIGMPFISFLEKVNPSLFIQEKNNND